MPTRTVPDDIWRSFQADQIATSYRGMVDDLSGRLTGALGLDPTSSPQSSGPPSPSSTSRWQGGLPDLNTLLTPFGGGTPTQTPASATPGPQPGAPPMPGPMAGPPASALPSLSALTSGGGGATNGASQPPPQPGAGLANGVPSNDGSWAGRARAAAVAAGHPDPDEFAAQMGWESGNFDPDVISGKRSSPAGARGIAQIMPEVASAAGVDPLDPDAALKYAAGRMANNYKTYGDSAQALAEYNMGAGNLQRYGPRGLPETATYIDRIQANARAARDTASPTSGPDVRTSAQPQPAPTTMPHGTYTKDSLVPNQLTEGMAQGLTRQEALAICGPAATVAFARANGRDPTLAEAKQMAQTLGLWDAGVGMHGPTAEVSLLGQMGVPSYLESGADEGRLASEVGGGRPAIIDTPSHYFVASDYDPASRQFEFGQSAGVLTSSGGRTRYRLDELPSLGMGAPRSTIYMQQR